MFPLHPPHWTFIDLIGTGPKFVVGFVALALAYRHRRAHPRVALLTTAAAALLTATHVVSLALLPPGANLPSPVSNLFGLGWDAQAALAAYQFLSDGSLAVCLGLLVAAIFLDRER